MKLSFSPASPFARKVRIAAIELGLIDKIEFVPATVAPGTPPGVGTGMKPPQFLNVGDVVTLGIEGLGEQRQEIVAA